MRWKTGGERIGGRRGGASSKYGLLVDAGSVVAGLDVVGAREDRERCQRVGKSGGEGPADSD